MRDYKCEIIPQICILIKYDLNYLTLFNEILYDNAMLSVILGLVFNTKWSAYKVVLEIVYLTVRKDDDFGC